MAVLDRRLAGTSGGEWLVDFEARTGASPNSPKPPPRPPEERYLVHEGVRPVSRKGYNHRDVKHGPLQQGSSVESCRGGGRCTEPQVVGSLAQKRHLKPGAPDFKKHPLPPQQYHICPPTGF